MSGPTALIADDEPLLRERLAAHLAREWPQLTVVAQARNGREAVQLFEQHRPQVAFLDVQMPGLDGIGAARHIAPHALVVFVTAYEQYAVQAFEHGALDYLLKPFDEPRLARTVQRLRERLQAGSAAPAGAEGEVLAVLDQLTATLRAHGGGRAYLQWIKASVGPSVRLIAVDQIAYFRSDEKYTLVAWAGGESLIRRTIRELDEELDPERFAQVHRSVIVNLHQVAEVVRGPNDTAELHLRGRTERLPVSRAFLPLFRQM